MLAIVKITREVFFKRRPRTNRVPSPAKILKHRRLRGRKTMIGFPINIVKKI